MKCIHLPSKKELAGHVQPARSFWARLKGLMGCKNLALGSGLLLDPCPQIHTCFMRFPIDVIFLDKTNHVVAVLENMPPWRMSKFYVKSRCTLELPGGSLQGCVHVGDELSFN